MLVGLLATGVTALAGNDKTGAVIMYHIFKSIIEQGEEGEVREIVTLQGNLEFTTAEWGTPIDILYNRMTDTQKCYQIMIIDKLIDPDTNIYYQYGIRDGDWIIAYGRMRDGTQRWGARNCNASIEVQKADLHHGMELLRDGYKWYVRILKVLDWQTKNGEQIPKRINIKDYALSAD
jgi:hypothetical protein